MVDYEKEFGKPGYQIRGLDAKSGTASIFRQVYGWMTVGLTLSGVIAWCTAHSGLWERILTGPAFLGCIIAELALVMILSWAINKLPAFVALVMFIAYAALNGVTLSVVFIAYELALVEKVFFITGGMFAGLVLWGSFTRDDLTSIGSFCGMALWGLIIAGIANWFFRSSGLDFICSIVGVLVFTGLTMYDAQKIKALAAAQHTMDAVTIRKCAIIGALELYLDFVNLFLHILRILGRRR